MSRGRCCDAVVLTAKTAKVTSQAGFFSGLVGCREAENRLIIKRARPSPATPASGQPGLPAEGKSERIVN
jgi:hypothetical protein